MRTIYIKGLKVEMYDSIEDLPITRFHKYNKMLLVDSGIGSDLTDFDRHIEKAMQYAVAREPEKVVSELQNMRQNVYFILSGLSPRHLAFAVLVKSINNKDCNDISDDGLQKIINIFADVPAREITAQFEAVKKKIDEELRLYFPALFDDATLKEYYDLLKSRTMTVLHTIIAGETTDEDANNIERLTKELITYFNPQNFAGSEGVEVQHDRQFENMCLIISRNLHSDPKKYTVLEYYNAFEFIKKEAQKAKSRKGAK